MYIFPAIDLYEGKAVRLLKGDYNRMTVYSDNPMLFAKDFEKQGAKHIHIVDLEGAKNGTTPNINTIKDIVSNCNLFVEVGGGIRSMDVIKEYIDAGVDRVILGTAAVKDENFLKKAIDSYKSKIAVGIDVKDGYVAVKGWTEKTNYTCFEFCEKMQAIGVETVICTDVSKDGAMQGTNHNLYKELSEKYTMNIIASGGITHIDDIINLKKLNIYGAIIGKAYYEKAVSIKDAVEVVK